MRNPNNKQHKKKPEFQRGNNGSGLAANKGFSLPGASGGDGGPKLKRTFPKTTPIKTEEAPPAEANQQDNHPTSSSD